MASNVIQRLSGVFQAARFNHCAARRSRGVSKQPAGGVPGSSMNRTSHQRFLMRFQIPMAQVCHVILGAAPMEGEAA